MVAVIGPDIYVVATLPIQDNMIVYAHGSIGGSLVVSVYAYCIILVRIGQCQCLDSADGLMVIMSHEPNYHRKELSYQYQSCKIMLWQRSGLAHYVCMLQKLAKTDNKYAMQPYD